MSLEDEPSSEPLHISEPRNLEPIQYWDALSVLEKRDAEEMLSRAEWADNQLLYNQMFHNQLLYDQLFYNQLLYHQLL